MIKNNNNSFSTVYDEITSIGKIYKGTLKVYEGWRNLISSGVPPLTLLKSGDKDLIDYKIHGNSVQDGTPTPEAPIEVESVGDKTKNLFNSNIFLDYGFEKNNDEYVGLSSSVKRTYWTNDKNIEGSLTFSFDVKYDSASLQGQRFTIVYTDDTVQNVYCTAYNRWVHKTVITPNAKNVASIKSDYGSRNITTYFKNIQLEIGLKETDYEPYGYKIPVAVSNNLFDTRTLEQGAIYDASGITNDNSTRVRTKFISLEAGTYTLRVDYETGKSFIRGVHVYNYETEVWEEYMAYNSRTVTFTLSKLSKVRFVFNNSANSVITPEDIIKLNPVLLIEGTTLENITTNIYLNEPLRKIGDYVDYVDFENGKVVRKVKELELTGKKEIYSNSYFTSANGYSIPPNQVSDYLRTSTYGFSNYFIKQNSSAKLTSGIVFGNNINIVVPFDMNLSTAEDFQEWLRQKYDEGTPVRIYYILATPTEETIELPNIPTIKSTTILEVDTTIKPSNMEVVYKGKK